MPHLIAQLETTSFCALLEHTPDSIVWFDNHLRIRYANPAVERTTGISAESLVGQVSRDLGVPELLVATWELVLRQVWRSGHTQDFDLTVRTPMGERALQSRIIPVPGSDGSVESLLTIYHDVTEQRRADAQRAALYERLLGQQSRSTPSIPPDYLNYRERHMLRLIAAGLTNREIAAEVGLAIGTVKNHVATILNKLNVADRTQAAVRAVELGLIQSDEP